jgi:hypothetical protein
MKNLIKVAFLFVVAVIAFASCSKDQKCVNWLEGADWKITKMEVTDSNNVTVDMLAQFTAQGLTFSGKLVFDKYSVKNDENGNVTTYTQVSGTVFGFPVDEKDTTVAAYRIQDDCETVWMKETGATEGSTSEILEASKTKMVISDYDATEKATTKITIEKQ